MKRGSGDAPAGAGSAGARAARTGTVGVLGGGRPLRRLHWLTSGGLFLLSSIKVETQTRDPYYQHSRQDALLERCRQEQNRVAADQQLPPGPKDQDY